MSCYKAGKDTTTTVLGTENAEIRSALKERIHVCDRKTMKKRIPLCENLKS